jgi:hypothetical protein
VDRGVFRLVLIQSLIVPITFLVSIAVAVTAGAIAAEYSWWLAFVLLLGLRSIAPEGQSSAPT